MSIDVNLSSFWMSFIIMATSAAQNIVDVSIRSVDGKEENIMTQFLEKTCKCTFGPEGTPCSATFDVEQITSSRNTIAEFTNEERDLLLLSFLRSSLNISTSRPVFSS